MTDYAIRALLCLATKNYAVDGEEIAETMHIPYSGLATVMAKLVEAGVVVSDCESGKYSLAKNQEDVSLWDIVEIIEGEGHSVCCHQQQECVGEDDYHIKRVQGAVQHGMEYTFRDITVRDLTERM
jgi:Rrf2 family protein